MRRRSRGEAAKNWAAVVIAQREPRQSVADRLVPDSALRDMAFVPGGVACDGCSMHPSRSRHLAAEAQSSPEKSAVVVEAVSADTRSRDNGTEFAGRPAGEARPSRVLSFPRVLP